MAGELSKTKAWITRHVGEMTPEIELVMYHMVSIRQTNLEPRIIFKVFINTGLHLGQKHEQQVGLGRSS